VGVGVCVALMARGFPWRLEKTFNCCSLTVLFAAAVL
jgi:hypothetical protein